MARDILLPELAESIVEAEIQRWLVGEGDAVAKDQPIVEVMTDKATVELPSPWAGVIEALLVQEGQVVPIHTAIARVTVSGEAPADAPPAPAEPARDASLFKPSEQRETVRNPFTSSRLRATPAARRVAKDLGVDLARVAGSGPAGRIRTADVRAAATPGAAPGPTLPPPAPYRTPAGYEDREERRPLRGLRRAIAQQMAASHLHAVRTLAVDEADLTALIAARDRLRPGAEASGVALTFLPFVFQALALTLERHPALNSSLDPATQEIVLKRYCHLGLAVATEAGLVVPVIRDVRDRSLLDLAAAIEALARRAREGRLAPEELTGSTFTVTSIGKVGTLFTFPIINVPDAAILGVHTITRRPVARIIDGEERIVVRDMVYLSLSFDHRLVDGFTAATFLRDLIGLLEAPERLALEA
jgi:2-oxoisovalerate dehydrogenase E2 component (dihydrolipoyl transacylase)